MSLRHLTNDELARNLLARDDLTAIETELLDRLVRTNDEMCRLDSALDNTTAQLEEAKEKLADMGAE